MHSNSAGRTTSAILAKRRGLLPEDVYRMRLVRDAQISPDGRAVAVLVREGDRSLDRNVASILLYDANTGLSRRLTTGPYEDTIPRWSPDGRWIAFISDRSAVFGRGPRSLYTIDVTGGEPKQLTHFEDDVSHFQMLPTCVDLAWAPDSKHICFTVKDPWRGNPPSRRVRVYDTLRFKLAEEGWFDGRPRHIWAADLNGHCWQVTFGDEDDFEPSWSSDSAKIVFTRTRDRTRNDRLVFTDVWITEFRDAGKERRLTESSGPLFSPSFSPNGNSVAYHGHGDKFGTWSRNAHLLLQPAVGGPVCDLLKGWEYPTGSILMGDVHDVYAQPTPVWSPDGSTLYFLANVGGTANLFAVSSDGGTPVPITTGEHEVVNASFDRGARRFAAVISTADQPGDVYIGDVGSNDLRRLTEVNADLLKDVHLSPAERISFPVEGYEIEGWVLRPANFDPRGKYPLVLQISPGPHFPHGHTFNFEYQVEAGAGYVVLYLNPRGMSGYGEAFIKARHPLWIGNDYDDYMAAVDHVIGLGAIDEARLGVTGDAYGAAMSAWIIAHNHRFAAAVARRGYYNFLSFFWTSDKAAAGSTMLLNAFGGVDPFGDIARYLDRSPLLLAQNITTPILIMHSEGDLRCEVSEAEQLYIALRYLNKTARMVIYRNDVHFLSRTGGPGDREHFFATIVAWFDENMPKLVSVEKDSRSSLAREKMWEPQKT